MRRTTTLAVTLSLLLAAAFVVSVGDGNDLRDDARRLRERLDRTETRLAITAGARKQAGIRATATSEALRRQENRIERLLDRLDTAEVTLRRLSGIERALVPGPRYAFDARLLRGAGGGLLVVQWHEDAGGATSTGVDVWRVDGGDPASWRLVHEVEPRLSRADVAATGDATGDGAADLAVIETDGGSGGCGSVILFHNLGSALRETFRRDGCNHDIAIEDGLLVYARAIYPGRCDYIHGCGERRTFMRWTGTRWTVERVERRVPGREGTRALEGAGPDRRA